jgi:hypothetical protein
MGTKKPDSPRDIRRALVLANEFLTVPKDTPIDRPHFKNWVAFIAQNVPSVAKTITEKQIISAFQISWALAGKPTHADKGQRVSAIKELCVFAKKKGVEVPASLSQRISL